MENTAHTPSCLSCVHSYQGADLNLRCRVHPNGIKCCPELADGCKAYRYEPGTDCDEITVNLCDCQGRGD